MTIIAVHRLKFFSEEIPQKKNIVSIALCPPPKANLGSAPARDQISMEFWSPLTILVSPPRVSVVTTPHYGALPTVFPLLLQISSSLLCDYLPRSFSDCFLTLGPKLHEKKWPQDQFFRGIFATIPL